MNADESETMMNSHRVLTLLLLISVLFLTMGVCFAQDNIAAGTQALEKGQMLSGQGSK